MTTEGRRDPCASLAPAVQPLEGDSGLFPELSRAGQLVVPFVGHSGQGRLQIAYNRASCFKPLLPLSAPELGDRPAQPGCSALYVLIPRLENVGSEVGFVVCELAHGERKLVNCKRVVADC
jgi:hypothetical protein